MKHKINVDEKDIKKGTPNDCNLCAVSQALKLKIDRDTVGYDFKVVAYKKVQSCMEDEEWK